MCQNLVGEILSQSSEAGQAGKRARKCSIIRDPLDVSVRRQ